jgi:hypothetical protein
MLASIAIMWAIIVSAGRRPSLKKVLTTSLIRLLRIGNF